MHMQSIILVVFVGLINIVYIVNSIPIVNNRSRSVRIQFSSRNASGDTFELRRRDIPLEYSSNPVLFPSHKDSQITYANPHSIVKNPIPDSTSDLSTNKFLDSNNNPRNKVLLPDLDFKGRPQCLSTPDDTFCETVNNYPKVELKKEIEYSPTQFLEIFGNNIDGRKAYSDDDLSEERICPRIPRVIYPKMAKNQANQWIYVINEVEYTQGVVAEICEKEGRQCSYLENSMLPPGMSSVCRQKYSYKRLLALHPTEKRTYTDTFKFPSCCACYVKSSEILERSIRSRKEEKRV